MPKFFHQLLICFLISSSNIVLGQCDDPHILYEIFMQLYEQTEGESWINNDGWRQGSEGTSCDPCADEWFGVNCVIGSTYFNIYIELDNNNLNGVLGREIFEAKGIRELNLANNQLTGEIDNKLNFDDLRKVNLSNNLLSGSIPVSFFDGQLNEILLSKNQFTGEIPIATSDQRVWTLDLSHNLLTGTIPVNSSFIEISDINLSHNKLTGIIPVEIFDDVDKVDLSFNEFEGTIPASIFFDNYFLKYLDLAHNNLSGLIPETIEDINRLEYLNLSHNRLEGEINFTSLLEANHLDTFNLSFNNFSGHLADFGKTSGIIASINFRGNDFSGCIPIGIIDRYCGSSFYSIDLGENPQLAFEGESVELCSLNANTFDEQIGAPCNSDNNESTMENIQLDCSCQSELLVQYSSDTLDMSIEGLNHQLVIHRAIDNATNEPVNIVNLFESENDLFFTGRNGVYKRKDGQIVLDRLNPIDWYSYYLFPPTDWSVSDDYARLFYNFSRFDDREFDFVPLLVSTEVTNRQDLEELLREHPPLKSFLYLSKELAKTNDDNLSVGDWSFLYSEKEDKSIFHKLWYSHFPEVNVYRLSGETEVKHPLNELIINNTQSSSEPILLSAANQPNFLIDACFVGEKAVLIGLPFNSMVHIYDPILDTLHNVTWSDDKRPLKVDAFMDLPIFILEKDGFQLGFEDQDPLNLAIIMDNIRAAGFTNEDRDVFVDSKNHIWIHHADLNTQQPIAEIILDPSITTSTDIKEIARVENDLKIYPNPVDERLHFMLNSNSKIDNLRYRILGNFGQALQEGTINNSSISIKHLIPGVYYLELFSENEKWVEKFIVSM